MRAVIVARDRKHAAMLRRADEIATVQRVASAINAGAFAVPHTEYAIDALAGEGIELLRAVQHGRRQVLVHTRLEADIAFRKQFLAAPQFLVQPAERRAAITRHETTGIKSGGAIEAGLFQ